jgi:hypothetical protein
MNGQTYTVQMPYGPTNFRSIIVKLYYIDNPIPNTPATDTPALVANNDTIIIDTGDLPVPKRSRRRPRGSKNKLYTKQEAFLITKKQRDLDLSI